MTDTDTDPTDQHDGVSADAVRELTTERERRAAVPILRELRDHLSADELADRLATMREEGYRLFGRFDGDDLVAVAGLTLGTNFYLGRYAFVHDLVTTADRRSEGHGAVLLAAVHDWARDQGCETVELESGLWREDAHRFYEEYGYERYCYSFKYDLDRAEDPTDGPGGEPAVDADGEAADGEAADDAPGEQGDG